MSGGSAIWPTVRRIFSISGLLEATGVKSKKLFLKPLLLLRTRLCFLIHWSRRHEPGYAGLFLVILCTPGSRRLGLPGPLLLRDGLDTQAMELRLPVNCKMCAWTREAGLFILRAQHWKYRLNCSMQ